MTRFTQKHQVFRRVISNLGRNILSFSVYVMYINSLFVPCLETAATRVIISFVNKFNFIKRQSKSIACCSFEVIFLFFFIIFIIIVPPIFLVVCIPPLATFSVFLNYVRSQASSSPRGLGSPVFEVVIKFGIYFSPLSFSLGLFPPRTQLTNSPCVMFSLAGATHNTALKFGSRPCPKIVWIEKVGVVFLKPLKSFGH